MPQDYDPSLPPNYPRIQRQEHDHDVSKPPNFYNNRAEGWRKTGSSTTGPYDPSRMTPGGYPAHLVPPPGVSFAPPPPPQPQPQMAPPPYRTQEAPRYEPAVQLCHECWVVLGSVMILPQAPWPPSLGLNPPGTCYHCYQIRECLPVRLRELIRQAHYKAVFPPPARHYCAECWQRIGRPHGELLGGTTPTPTCSSCGLMGAVVKIPGAPQAKFEEDESLQDEVARQGIEFDERISNLVRIIGETNTRVNAQGTTLQGLQSVMSELLRSMQTQSRQQDPPKETENGLEEDPVNG